MTIRELGGGGGSSMLMMVEKVLNMKYSAFVFVVTSPFFCVYIL